MRKSLFGIQLCDQTATSAAKPHDLWIGEVESAANDDREACLHGRNSVTAVDRLLDRLMTVKVDTGEVESRVVSAYAPQMG
ncbi:hypothetical protein RB195_008373 [Necator americanus]|uniref:Uncharacterized protein n=1 Tax=Necator americanus TaxID=51031 RepID=A0ABR1CRP7_NECAM